MSLVGFTCYGAVRSRRVDTLRSVDELGECAVPRLHNLVKPFGNCLERAELFTLESVTAAGDWLLEVLTLESVLAETHAGRI